MARAANRSPNGVRGRSWQHGADRRQEDAASPLAGHGLGVLAPDKLLLPWLPPKLAEGIILHSWQAADPAVQLGALSSAQHQEVRWGAPCPAAGLYLGLGATTAIGKQQQELREETAEKEKGKQGGLTTKQTGNLKPPSFHELVATEVLGAGTSRCGCRARRAAATPPCKYGFQMTSMLHMDKVVHNSSAPSPSLLELAEAVNSWDNCQEVPESPTHTCPTGEKANALDWLQVQI